MQGIEYGQVGNYTFLFTFVDAMLNLLLFLMQPTVYMAPQERRPKHKFVWFYSKNVQINGKSILIFILFIFC